MSCDKKRISTKLNYSRQCYSLNNTYKFKIIFKDCEILIDPDAIEIFITKPDATNEVLNNPVRVEEGFYYLEYNVNQIGTYTIEWRATFNNEVKTYEATFVVKDGIEIEEIKFGLDFNEIISIEVQAGIQALNGNESLEENTILNFSTEYNPFYCSVEMLRMEMGSWVDLVPDETLALAIHWSSLEADNITSRGSICEEYFYARTRFVMYDAAIKLFSMPISLNGTGKSKQLGDLLIEDGSSLDYNLKDLIYELKEERDEWWRVVNARGTIVLGQGLGPSSATKGASNAIKKSREWHDPWSEHYIQPTQNSQYRRQGQKRYRHGFTGWNEHYYTSMKNGIGRRK